MERRGKERCASLLSEAPDAIRAAAAAAGLTAADTKRSQQLFEESLISTSLMLPLSHLALRIFSAKASVKASAEAKLGSNGGALPGSFSENWLQMLQPLCQITAVWAAAFDALAEASNGKQQPVSALREEELYDIDLGEAWWTLDQPRSKVE